MTPLRLRPQTAAQDRIEPTLACLRREEVLIQAWKKHERVGSEMTYAVPSSNKRPSRHESVRTWS